MKGILFDLDDTLVNSSFLRQLRTDQEWVKVREGIVNVEAFPRTVSLLRKIKAAGSKIGIVTSSPKWYAEALVAQHGFEADAIVAHGDYKWGKPGPEPIDKAVTALGISSKSNILAVGDRCVDSASAHAAGVKAIGATWAAGNQRDLILSYPQYLAASVEEAEQLIMAWLSPTPPKDYSWSGQITDLKGFVWRTNPDGDFRQHLYLTHDYSHARFHYKGPWSVSNSNSLVKSFKAKESNQRRFKVQAAQRFCQELTWFLPNDAYVTYILPSIKKGESGYDDRWEILAECLGKKGIRSLWPLQIKASTASAHSLPADSPLRDPNVIKTNLEWKEGLPTDCSKIYIIDDVLTKGGHMRAYADFIKAAYPSVSVHCVAWAIHTSEPWFQTV